MSREELLKTIRLCKTDGSAECEECSLYGGTKGDCISALLQECEEEIVFLDGLLAAERMLEDALRKQVELRNERLDKMCAEIDHLREVTKMMPKWVSVKERVPKHGEEVLVLTAPGTLSVGQNQVVAEYIHPINEKFGVFINFYAGYDDKNLLSVTHWMPLPSTEGVE